MDGYYCSEQEINSVSFISDSTLVVLANQTKIKVLYTKKFHAGDYTMIDVSGEHLLKIQLARTVELTRFAELETGHEVSSLRAAVISGCQTMNFNNVIFRFKRSIIYLGQNQLHKSRLYTWREYLEKLRHTDNYSWLTVLKAALEIYNGDLKGFAKVPDEKEQREQELKQQMRDMIKDSLQMVIYKFVKGHEPGDSIEEIAIKVAIEFCLNIGETDYLFNDVFALFVEN